MWMDYIALAGTNCFLRRRKTNRRMLLTAFLSSMSSLFLTLHLFNHVVRICLIHFCLNPAMIFLCFGKSRKKEWFENWAVTYGMTIFLGGIMQLLKENTRNEKNFCVMALCAAVVLFGTNAYLNQRKQFGMHLYPAVLFHREKQVQFNAYWDSGNQLKDPYNGMPVCIISHRLAAQIVDKKHDFVHFVPYVSLGQKDGILPVVQLERMCLYQGKKEIERKPIEVGIANEGLLEQKEYDLILHASFLED